MSAARAAFLDKDGTLVEDVPYNVDPERIVLCPGAREGVAALASAGYQPIVVSNQPGVALGLFDEARLAGVERRLRELLPELRGFYYCPHAPQAGCDCRKPGCALLQRAASEHAVRLEGSWMIGDILDDVEAGRRAGCRAALIDKGHETRWELDELRLPDCVAADLRQAVAFIVEMEAGARVER
jgi:histidinol-phosphate phosphatase family protein